MSLVLVVEDDPAIRTLICAILETEGMAVVAVGDGMAAIRWLSQQRPALVVLDMNLPGAGGEQVASALHRRYERAVPLVVVTADWRADKRAEAVNATGYIRKPFDLEALLDVIAKATSADGIAHDH